MLKRATRSPARMLTCGLAVLAGAGRVGGRMRFAHATAGRHESSDLARAVVCEIDHVRAERGLHRVRVNHDMEQAARRHTLEMVRRNFFSHESPGGATPADRLRRSGYLRRDTGWHVGETIAADLGVRH